MRTVGYSLTTRCLYDYLVRDFFGYLVGKKNGWVSIPGTHEIVWLGDAWLSRAQTAYDRAVKASRYENDEMPYSARGVWQKNLRNRHPVTPVPETPTQALIDECLDQSKNCTYTSTTFFVWLRWLRIIRLVFLVVPAGLRLPR